FPSQLFRNNGDGTFTDIAAEAGVTNDRFSKGVTAGDYDNDGDLDLYVSNVGKNRLYRNDLSA
ncbi:MAG TPA: CRTAC1 family protein, partial [Verrucomicrobiales bacterium]|nr:CRTAC1 family protein [Verrucomicrobiales bacterium]